MGIGEQAREQTYKDMRKLIHHTAWKFSRKHGCDPDEAHSEAVLAYCLAYRDYAREKGTQLSTYVVHRVWWHLVRWHERERMNKHETIGERDFPEHHSSLRTLLTDLSEDAVTVVRLSLLELPNDLCLLGVPRKGEHGGITSFLTGMGWTVRRAFEAFREIKEALS